MPVFQLTDEIAFPPPNMATEEGLLAVGGDLSRERLLLAYREGIFPWFSEGEPILWWSPNPRMLLFPEEFRSSRRMRRLARSGRYEVRADTAFEKVIEACAKVPRPGQDGTWITASMEQAYCDLHRSGYAHSVECWEDDQLVGGLYGVSLGRCFFGESMFSNASNTSKLALWTLAKQLTIWDFLLIDCQIHTDHVAGFGARPIDRDAFMRLLDKGVQSDSRKGQWQFEADILVRDEDRMQET